MKQYVKPFLPLLLILLMLTFVGCTQATAETEGSQTEETAPPAVSDAPTTSESSDHLDLENIVFSGSRLIDFCYPTLWEFEEKMAVFNTRHTPLVCFDFDFLDGEKEEEYRLYIFYYFKGEIDEQVDQSSWNGVYYIGYSGQFNPSWCKLPIQSVSCKIQISEDTIRDPISAENVELIPGEVTQEDGGYLYAYRLVALTWVRQNVEVRTERALTEAELDLLADFLLDHIVIID